MTLGRNNFEYLFGIKRFRNIVRSPKPKSFLRHLDALVAGYDDDRKFGAGFFDAFKDLQAVNLGHFDVQEHCGGGEGLEHFDGLEAIGGELEVVVVLKDKLEGFADAFLVVTDEDSWFLGWIRHKDLLLL